VRRIDQDEQYARAAGRAARSPHPRTAESVPVLGLLPRQPAEHALRLQRLAGNRASRDLLQPPTVQRVHEQEIRSGGKPKGPIGIARRAAKDGDLILVKRTEAGWEVDQAASTTSALNNLTSERTHVTAFVQPFDPQYRNELWLFMQRGGSGQWGDARGSHASAKDHPAMAAGEAKWTVAKQGAKHMVTLLAVNQQTKVYGLKVGAAQDPRATQSDLLADYQRLIFHGMAEFQASAYFASAKLAEGVRSPENLDRGQYMVVNGEVTEEQRKKLLERGITPLADTITYRPTQEDRDTDAARRLSLGATSTGQQPAPLPPVSGPITNNQTTTTTTMTTTSTTTEAANENAPPPAADVVPPVPVDATVENKPPAPELRTPDQPVPDQPVVDQPVPDQPMPDQPVVDQPVVDQPGPAQLPPAQFPPTQLPPAQNPLAPNLPMPSLPGSGQVALGQFPPAPRTGLDDEQEQAAKRQKNR
jgi:hypothetical protein